MSNSNPPFGSYLDSSDHEGDHANTVQQQVTYVPPRVTVASRSGLGSFQLPSSAASRTSVPPAGKPDVSTARHSSVPLNRGVPVHSVSRRLTPGGSSAVQSRQGTPTSTAGALSRDNTVEPSNPSALRVPSTQPNILLERQVNQLSESFEEYQSTAAQRHTLLDSTLTRILTRINQLEAAALSSGSLGSQTSSTTASTSLITPSVVPAPLEGLNPELFPPATPELIEIVKRVSGEARLRVGNRKSGADENLAKEHTRQTFYRFINITSSREVKAYFQNEFGEPDPLPAQFIDPVTGECPVFPHWKAPLSKQVDWIPAFLRRFRLSIPNNGSCSSEMLRSLTDEAILTLLVDGTFKTCAAAWHRLGKTNDEIAQMQADSRVYQRAERKANMRRPYIQSIPDLQSPKFEYLSHAGYMSPDESDGEGGLCTKRPDYRARWINNLYTAIDVAEREKPSFRPGLRPRRTEIVRRPIPQLERGRGSSKTIVRVAHCGISKIWRETYPEDFKRYAPLINSQDTIKPNIASFLERYPESSPDNNSNVVTKPEPSPQNDTPALNSNVGGSPRDFGSWDGLNYLGDEEGGGILEMNGSWVNVGAAEQGGTPLANGSEVYNSDAIEIDPQVLEDEARQQTIHTAVAHDASSNLPSPSNVFSTSHVSDMPPPPPLNPVQHENANQAALQATGGSSANKGKKRAPPETSEEVGGLAEEGEKEVPVRKRRGRPPGSKNKPKTGVQKE